MRRRKRWRNSFRDQPGRLAVVLALLYLLTSSSIHLFHSGHVHGVFGCRGAAPCAVGHADHYGQDCATCHDEHKRDHEDRQVHLAGRPAAVHTSGQGPCPACLFTKTNHIPRLLKLGLRRIALARVAWTPAPIRTLPVSHRIVPQQPRAPPAT